MTEDTGVYGITIRYNIANGYEMFRPCCYLTEDIAKNDCFSTDRIQKFPALPNRLLLCLVRERFNIP